MDAPSSPGLRSVISSVVGRFDAEVTDLLDEHLRGRRWADRLMYGASALGDHGLLWMIIAVTQRLRRGDGTEADRQLARAVVGIVVESALVNGPVKLLFRRSRPSHDGPRPLALRTPRSSSFPSGHATSAFFSAGLLRENDPLWPLYYAAAAVVATSRVHVDIHHASDVAGGVILGVALGELARRLVPLAPPPSR